MSKEQAERAAANEQILVAATRRVMNREECLKKYAIDKDLSGADLRGADLSGADLRDAKLRDAKLRYADLRDADLRGADLRDANLRDADLRGANIAGVILSANFKIARLDFGDWSVLVTPTETSIGCQTHPNKKWLKFTPKDVATFADSASAWWKQHGAAIKAVIKDVSRKAK